jgi:hypothetical protein
MIDVFHNSDSAYLLRNEVVSRSDLRIILSHFYINIIQEFFFIIEGYIHIKKKEKLISI